ncbi:mannose-1-phosphate guanylyltransferase [Halobacteriovorax sp. HLS]|uniref:mannose-1-phosphate guanylyltransferase n=1 Tax=Halobacteriovorax sp. HLS TaxID=2234000 RepID=UPI000FD9ABBE|nr:mannose-1-phosphate guanylyltransferase [Halobacteriovorax sp. HLS]
MTNIYALIMAGGQGTRFWPESTSKKPKQYLSLVSKQSLLADTLARLEGLVEVDKRFIVTVEAQKQLASQNSQGMIGKSGIVLEPSGRNTAPCILLSIATLLKNGASKDDVVAILPSDHVILNKSGFQQTLSQATLLSKETKNIVTIGIPPHFPHTGYGYIQRGKELSEGSFKVSSFKEKPNFETAAKYLEEGKYFWNAGMFVAEIGVLLDEFKEHSAETFSFYNDLYEAIGDDSKVAKVYSQMPADSIDYAVMEKSQKVSVCQANFDWNDLGSWDALSSVIEDTDGNTLVAGSNHYFEESKGNIIFAPGKFVSLINVNDLIIISNEKNVVVLPKSDSQNVKNVVSFLKEQDWGKELL